MRLHKDWIVDLYYKEMVNNKKENDHDKYKKSTFETKASTERNRGVSIKLPSQK